MHKLRKLSFNASIFALNVQAVGKEIFVSRFGAVLRHVAVIFINA